MRMPFMNHRILLLLLALIFSMASASAADLIRVLLVDGQNNHDWKATSGVLKTELLSSGMFTVDVATTPPAGASPEAWKSFSPDFGKYDVVLLNYYGKDWPQAALSALESYVENGGGLAAFHAGGSSFEKDETYNRMIGLAWRKKDFGPALAMDKDGKLVHIAKGSGMDASHGAKNPFTLVTRAPDHPIMKGFPAQWGHLSDELYHSLRGPAENLEILATAHSPITGMEEPMAWTVKFGKGRVFYTALGHDITAIECLGFQNLMARGLEWAARGTVASSRLLTPFAETIKPIWILGEGQWAVCGDQAADYKRGEASQPHRGSGGTGRQNYMSPITPAKSFAWKIPTGMALKIPRCCTRMLPRMASNIPMKMQRNIRACRRGPGLRYPTALDIQGKRLLCGHDLRKSGFTRIPKGRASPIRATLLRRDGHTRGIISTGPSGLRFGPDGYLYANLTTDYLNAHPAPDPLGLRGSMIRISPDGKTFERYAYGLRFAYGIAFNEAGDLFCTDNEGGDNPAEKLNYITKGGNYGHHPKLATGPKLPPVLWITAHLEHRWIGVQSLDQ